MTAINKWNRVIHDMFLVKLCSHPQQISKQANDLIPLLVMPQNNRFTISTGIIVQM